MVSVIMPVYNADAYVGESIRSILGQSFTDFELIVVDDGSNDGTDEVIRGFADPRLVHHRQENRGVAHALNIAMDLAHGTFVARQDADDIARPERLARQVARFQAEPGLIICGTWARIINAHRQPGGTHHHPTHDAEIQYALLFDSPFVSSSVMFRHSDRNMRFDPSPSVFEDFNMWSRLARSGRCANIGEELVDYRELVTGLSHTTRNTRERVMEQRRRNLAHWNGGPDERIDLLARLGFEHPAVDAATLRAAQHLMMGIIDRLNPAEPTRRTLERDLHRRLLGFHLHQRRNIWGKALDLLHKEWVLRTCGRT